MRIFVGLGVLVVLLLAILLVLPFLVDLNQYQDRYKPLIEEAFNRKVVLQDVRLTIWPRLGVRVAGVTVQEDPAFGAGPFVSFTSLDVGVKLLPLLSRRVEVEEVTLRDPLIAVIKDRKGEMNLSTIGVRASAASSPGQSAANPLQVLALLAVDRFAITGGAITYRDESTPEPMEYRVNDLELLLKSVHLGETPTLHLAATLQPYNIPVRLDGSGGPLVDMFDLKQFTFDLGLGKIAMGLKGSLVGGNLTATLTAPVINSADLPMALPLTKPVLIKDFHATVKAHYPLPPGGSAEQLVDIHDLGFAVAMGQSLLTVQDFLATKIQARAWCQP